MTSTGCAPQDIVDRLESFNSKFSQFVDLLAIVLTFVSSHFAVKLVFTQSIFQTSTKILLMQNLFYANLHQIFYSFEAISIIYRGFFLLSDPCHLLVSVKNCLIYFEFLLMSTSGMIIGQTGLLIERACATFSVNYNAKQSLCIGGSISLIVLIISVATGPLILWDDPLDGYVVRCFSVPEKSEYRSHAYCFICTVLTLFNFAFSIWIIKYNKRGEYEIRFKVRERFRKREVIESTGAICYLTLSQFVAMFIYSFGMFLLRIIRNIIQPSTFHFWIVWFYTVPFIAFMFPVFLIYFIHRTHLRRTMKIMGITKKHTQDEHICQMKSMWS